MTLYFAAKKSSSPRDLAVQLEENGFPKSADTQAFAQQLYNRVPRKKTGINVSHVLH